MERSRGQVDEPPRRSRAPLGEAFLGELSADLIDLLMRADTRPFADLGIGEASGLRPNQSQHPFAIGYGLNSTLSLDLLNGTVIGLPKCSSLKRTTMKLET